jgi:hypothetical protein
MGDTGAVARRVSGPMMRCSNCNRDYPDALRFCHQCGEVLQPHERAVVSPSRRDAPATASGRARAVARRGAPTRSSSLAVAVLVVVAAGVSLALIWYKSWTPPLVAVSARLPEPEAPRPSEPLTPRPAPEAEPTEPARPARSPEPVLPPTPAPTASSRAPGTTPAATPLPAAESASPKASARSDAPALEARRPPGPWRAPAPAPQKSAARSDPEASSILATAGPRTDAAAGLRVITLVPVGSGAGARAQLHWEFSQGGRLVVSGLAQPPPGRTYQLWLGSIKLGHRTSGGLLTLDAQGDGTLRVAPPRASWSPDIFGVTVERQGGAREPSDELVLVGELGRTATVAAKDSGAAPTGPAPRASSSLPATAPAPSGAPALSASAETKPPSPTVTTSGSASTGVPVAPAPAASRTDSPAAVTASRPPAASAADAPTSLVRIVPVPVERAWAVTQSVLRSLGWDIERTERADGLIRTEPRNLAFKNVGVYAAGTRHSLDLVVRAVSETHTSIAVKRELFEEQRIFWSRERTRVPSPDTAVEQAVLDAIEHLL